MTSINDNYGRGGFAYLGDTANISTKPFKPDPTIAYFKDGIEDVGHLYPVIRSYRPNLLDILNLLKHGDCNTSKESEHPY